MCTVPIFIFTLWKTEPILGIFLELALPRSKVLPRCGTCFQRDQQIAGQRECQQNPIGLPLLTSVTDTLHPPHQCLDAEEEARVPSSRWPSAVMLTRDKCQIAGRGRSSESPKEWTVLKEVRGPCVCTFG